MVPKESTPIYVGFVLGGVCAHLFDGFAFLLLFVGVEFGFELEDFALLGGGEVLGVRHPA